MNFDASKYIESPSYGVNRFLLDRIGDEKARATTIVEYQPRSKFPMHTHIGGEEFLVLEGTFKDQFGAFPAGTYVRNPIGSQHEPWVDEDGCTIMVKLLQMAETPLQETSPLHILYEKEEKERQGTKFGSVLEMYSNQYTGEHVQMLWLDPNTILPVDQEATDGGEELFITEGTLLLGDEEYRKWGWLRFPPSLNGSPSHSGRSSLRAGENGARVYRKMGHLTPKALAMEKIQITDDE